MKITVSTSLLNIIGFLISLEDMAQKKLGYS